MELGSLFSPDSIAVIGASAREGSVGNIYLRSILEGGYRGRVHPINPKYEEIMGLECLDSVDQVKVDLALIATNRSAALGLLEQAASAGARAAIIPTGGFEEVGEEGARLEGRIRSTARENGIALLGTNTLGLINNHLDLQVNFNPVTLPSKGGVSIVSQSGGMGLSVLSKMREEGVGLSKWIGVGNRTLLDFPEFLEHLADDESTAAVGIFMEGTERAREMCYAARRMVGEKPVVVYKMGRSDATDYLAVTHTGTGVGSREVYRGAFEQHGIIQATSVRQMVACLKALSSVPPIQGEELGMFTYTAGPTIAAADLLDRFRLRQPSEDTKDLVRSEMRGEPPALLKNPLDVDGEGYTASQYQALLEAFMHEGYDLYATVSTAGLLFPKEALLKARERAPLLHCHVSPADGSENLDGVPVYTTAEELAWGLNALSEHARIRKRRERPPGEPIPLDASHLEVEILDEHRAKSLLSLAGVPVAEERLVGGKEELLEAAEEIGYPVALKVLSPGVLHKSEEGGVILDLGSRDELLEAFEGMRGKWPAEDLLVQRMSPPGVELIVGRKRDPAFGEVISLGVGGFLADLFPPAVATCPCSLGDALDLVDRMEPQEVLDGYRGLPKVDRTVLAELVERVGRIRLTGERIEEMDLNPVIVSLEGMRVVDALIRRG
ncbi:MAG: acetate--CoA ligase family protein [Methanomassiliicoccales archaeon]